MSTVRLTQFARCAGCASKMGPGDLTRALEALPYVADARLLVGRETFDDAAVFQLSDDLALVQTIDFFAPIVDDPYLFGQVAAANALSDVYAMGGEPLTALNVVGFPTGALPLSVLTDILRGGQDKVHEAGAVLAGGHTVVDEEVKYGLSVTGRIDPRRILSNANAQVGDVLVLTKAIGTGILATAAKRDDLDARLLDGAITSMRTLNRDASRAAVALALRCATDVTGFALLGHASHIARASAVTLRIDPAQLPVLEGAREAWTRGARTGGAERNELFVESRVDWGQTSEVDRAILLDPQTSGGLLVAVPAVAVADYLSRVDGAVVIGAVESRGRHDIVLG
ncbi:MAG: selenide, water dikinase SelD [Gemmatimonadaceae bacterium]